MLSIIYCCLMTSFSYLKNRLTEGTEVPKLGSIKPNPDPGSDIHTGHLFLLILWKILNICWIALRANTTRAVLQFKWAQVQETFWIPKIFCRRSLSDLKPLKIK